MSNLKKCSGCGDEFAPDHGNSSYCSTGCQEEAKKERQKRKRDPIKEFIPILMRNHASIHSLYKKGILKIIAKDFELYKIDISLCRHLMPPTEFTGMLLLDFGQYYMITDKTFSNFKIFKHENATPESE